MVQQLSNLAGLETFNSTLSAWGRDAALTHTHNPMLHHVYFVHTNMTQLPDAVMHDQLPRSFQYLFCYDTNLTQLPPSIDQIWGLDHVWIVLSFINTPLTQLPDSFGLLPVSILHLLNTKLTQVAEVTIPQLSRLRISGPDFHDLPSQLHTLQDQKLLPRGFFIQKTSVETLPDWTIAWLDQALLASGDGTKALHASLFGSTVCLKPEYAKYARFCAPDVEFDLNTFPYHVVAAQRPL